MGWLHSPWDKFMHGSVYACLGFAFALCFRRSLWEEKKFFCLLSGFLLGALYGGLDEFHQSFVPGREAGASDWIADALGSLAGVFAYYFLAIKVGVFSQTKKL